MLGASIFGTTLVFSISAFLLIFAWHQDPKEDASSSDRLGLDQVIRAAEGRQNSRTATSNTDQITLIEGPVKLSASPDKFSELPRIAVSQDGSAQVVWQEEANTSLGTDVASRFREFGGTWSPELRISSSESPSISSWGANEFAVVYARGIALGGPVDYKLYYKRWNNDEKKWSGSKAIAGGVDGIQPDIAYVDSNYLFTWVNVGSGVRRPQWSMISDEPSPIPYTDALSTIDSMAQGPRVVAASDGPGQSDGHFVWMNDDPGGSELDLAKLDIASRSLSAQSVQPFFLNGVLRGPALASRSRSEVCLSWEEETSFQNLIFRDIILRCQPWTQSERVTDSETGAQRAQHRLA